MDPPKVFCPNWACPARGQTGAGHIGIPSQKEKRYSGRECHKTLAARKGPAFYRRRTAAATVRLGITLWAYGGPVPAMVAAFGLDARSVGHGPQRAGQPGQAGHALRIEPPRDLGQVPADEIRVKKQGGIVGMARALRVRSRLGLGGVVSPSRNTGLITALVQKVRAAAAGRPRLLCGEGLAAYIRAARPVFGQRRWTGQAGRPRWPPGSNRMIAQRIKQDEQGRVVGVLRRIGQGTAAAVAVWLQRSPGGGVIHTAFIERRNATFRSRWACWVRRGRAWARQVATGHQGRYLIGSVDNFCTYHDRLRQRIGRRRWSARTPAMATGLTD